MVSTLGINSASWWCVLYLRHKPLFCRVSMRTVPLEAWWMWRVSIMISPSKLQKWAKLMLAESFAQPFSFLAMGCSLVCVMKHAKFFLWQMSGGGRGRKHPAPPRPALSTTTRVRLMNREGGRTFYSWSECLSDMKQRWARTGQWKLRVRQNQQARGSWRWWKSIRMPMATHWSETLQ